MEFEIVEVYSGEKYEDICLTSLYLVEVQIFYGVEDKANLNTYIRKLYRTK